MHPKDFAAASAFAASGWIILRDRKNSRWMACDGESCCTASPMSSAYCDGLVLSRSLKMLGVRRCGNEAYGVSDVCTRELSSRGQTVMECGGRCGSGCDS